MNANKIGGVFFALWGVLHVVVGTVALIIFVTNGPAALLNFVNVDAAVNDQFVRMAHLVAEFYQALLLIGLTVTIIGLTLNWNGESLGLWINVVLVASIDSFFIWFEVIPGHRPLILAIISVALFVLGVVYCWRGLREDTRSGQAS